MRTFISEQLNKNDNLLRHSLFILVAAFIVNILNYAFQLYMGRVLGPIDYGVLGVLFSLFYVLNTPANTINTVITKFSSEYRAKEEYNKIRYLLTKSFKLIGIYGSVFLIAYVLLSKYIASFLNIDNVFPVILIGVMIFLSFLSPITSGLLMGLQKFGWYNANSLIHTGLKLGLGILLVSLGFGVAGAIISVNISILLVILLPLVPLAFLFKYQNDIKKLNIFKYSLVILFGSAALMFIVNIDVILVKHFFSSLEAGYYVAASTLAKITWFASSALLMVMFPKISDRHNKNLDSSSILKNTLFYTFLISFMVVLVYFIAPTFVSGLLYGKEYKIAGLIGYFSVGLGFFALNNVLMLYNFGVNKIKFVYLIVFFAILETVLISLFHSTLLEVIKTVSVVNILLFFSLILYTKKELGVRNGIT